MKIAVTGGAGFIGANLCRHLSDAVSITEVVALDNLSNAAPDNLDGIDAKLIEGDITNPDDVDAALDGASAVVHLAALGSVPRSIANPLASHHNNATGTLQVLEGARRAGDVHTIVASSSSVYGATETLPKHEGLPTRPMSPYGASKLAAEWYALSYQHSMDLPVLAFRFFNVFGPLQPADHVYAAVIPRFVQAALNGEPLTIYGDGLQSRDFTYVDTVCSTITRAVVEQTTSAVPVNLAFGQPRTLLDVVAELGELLDTDLHVDHVAPRPGDIRHSDADSSRLYELFPSTVPTPFRDGLEATVEWFRSL
jgi:UDP-glucose 4-epimerase